MLLAAHGAEALAAVALVIMEAAGDHEATSRLQLETSLPIGSQYEAFFAESAAATVTVVPADGAAAAGELEAWVAEAGVADPLATTITAAQAQDTQRQTTMAVALVFRLQRIRIRPYPIHAVIAMAEPSRALLLPMLG